MTWGLRPHSLWGQAAQGSVRVLPLTSCVALHSVTHLEPWFLTCQVGLPGVAAWSSLSVAGPRCLANRH